MHAKDRIVTDSDQHWVLFALKKYEDITGNRGVSPSALHTELGEKLPSADYIEAAFEELEYRDLIIRTGLSEGEEKNPEWGSCPPSGMALESHGKPERTPWTNPVTFAGEATVDVDDDWLETTRDRIFYESVGDRFERGEQRMAKAVAEKFPEWNVVIKMHPYVMHDVMYRVSSGESPVIELSFHSRYLGEQYLEAMLWQLEITLKKDEIRQRFSGETSGGTQWKQMHEAI